ncbi:hypothetical protein BHE74_00044925 [Ensete ventricosum]|nr:hypothetical protein BHE74_00044925 [Ensete ventricosum]
MKVFLQKFEPGYTIPEKKALIDVGVTISAAHCDRGSLEVPRLNYDPHNPEFVADDDAASDRADCSPSSRRRASYCRSIVLLVFLLRASGILLPFYLVMRFVSAFQEAHRQDQLLHVSSPLPLQFTWK